jgi:hypothetical protein
MRGFIFILAGLALVAGWSNAARADTFICGNGPGPGERQVGTTRTADGNGTMPVCERIGTADGNADDGPSSMTRGALREVGTYIAVVLHPEANEPWAVWNDPRSEEHAKERALTACSAAMGDGCTIVASGQNASVALAYVGNQLAEAVLGDTRIQASQNALEKCRESGLRCKVEYVFSATPDMDMGGIDLSSASYLPTRENVKRFERCPENFRRCGG